MPKRSRRDEVEVGYLEAEAADPTKPTQVVLPAQLSRPARVIATQVRRPHVAATLGTIDNILWAELKALEQKSASGLTLGEEELRRFAVLSDIALKKTREEREQEKHERLDQETEEELMKQAHKALRVLGKGDADEV